MSNRWDETWHRLIDWTNGQGPSERLAAQILLAEGFSGVDPSHPLGGRDRGKDALANKDDRRWVMAAYFPRGQQPFRKIRQKFLTDHEGLAANNAEGLVFVTNQELSLAEREKLCDAVTTPVEIYHLDRITTILDQPSMHPVRAQFLAIEPQDGSVTESIAQLQSRLEGFQTGGDSYCYVMLYNFDLQSAVAKEFVVIRRGEYPLYDVRFTIYDVDLKKQVYSEQWGELNSPADYRLVQWHLRDSIYYRITFFARNGNWNQDLQLRKSTDAGCWLAATRIVDIEGNVRFEHVDGAFIGEFGQPEWGP